MRTAGHATEEHERELNTIDIALTEILLSAEASLKPQPRTNRRGHFSKSLDEALWTVVYWRKRVKMLTTNTLQDKLATAMGRSGQRDEDIRWHPKVGLRRAHRNLDRVKRDLFSKRQTQLEELAEALAEENGNTKEMQLKALRNKEKMAADYKAVKSALNSVNDKRRGGGLTRLQISENGVTQPITEPEKMAETLRDYAVKHYGQANHTIFRHGEGHDLLTNGPM